MANGIGGRTVRELNSGPNNEGMDVEEFLTWAAYFSIEPPLAARTDAHTAMLMAQQYNMNRGKGRPVRKPSDFMPQWHRTPKTRKAPMPPDALKRAAQMQFMALGGEMDEAA